MYELISTFGEALIGLIGVLVGGLIVGLNDSWKFYRSKRLEASYASVMLVNILDEYAEKCIAVVQDDGTAYGQPAGRTDDGEMYYSAQVSLPISPHYPDDISWRSLDQTLMKRALMLPVSARHVNGSIESAAEHDCPPDYELTFHSRQLGYAKLAIEVLEILAALRKLYKITTNPKFEINNWNPKEYLERQILHLENPNS